MKVIKWFFVGIYLFSLITVLGQNGTISGIVIDNTTSDKIPFASVSVFDKNFEHLINGSASNNKGRFKIDKLPFGEYEIVVSFIGYIPDTLDNITITNQNSSLNLDEIAISPSVVEIEGIEVQGLASTVSRKIDRQTYRASDFETAQVALLSMF